MKVTSKYQVTLPRSIADQYNIRPGDRIDWTPAGEGIRVVREGKTAASADAKSRLHWFDLATKRQQQRAAARKSAPVRKTAPACDREWKREDLYERGRLYPLYTGRPDFAAAHRVTRSRGVSQAVYGSLSQ